MRILTIIILVILMMMMMIIILLYILCSYEDLHVVVFSSFLR